MNESYENDTMNTTSNNTEASNNNEVQIEPSGVGTTQQENVQPEVSGNTEVLEPVGLTPNETTYEEVEPQYQEVSITEKPKRTDSYFDGGLLELIGWRVLGFLITVITLGIGKPWAECMLLGYQYNHTVYNGKRLKFEGKGGDLFVNYFKWILFTIITLGIYLFFIPVRKKQWEIANLHFEDETFVKGESFFDGKVIHLIGVNILCSIMNAISLGLLFTFTTCFKLKWISRHTIINKKRIAFTGSALNLFGKYLLWVFLTIITFGIYGWWLSIKMLKWTTKNTHIKVVGEVPQKDNSLVIAIIVGVIGLILFVAVVPKAIAAVTTGWELPSGNSICINPFTCKTDNSIKRTSDSFGHREAVNEVRAGY